SDKTPKNSLFKLSSKISVVLSERYESNGDPGLVSSGNGDYGGKSYLSDKTPKNSLFKLSSKISVVLTPLTNILAYPL
ncbi:VgrG-related protein, partial [Escherichia sp. TWPC-MK]